MFVIMKDKLYDIAIRLVKFSNKGLKEEPKQELQAMVDELVACAQQTEATVDFITKLEIHV